MSIKSDVPDIAAVKTYFLQLQQKICDALTQEDGAGFFKEEVWERAEGGGGQSCNFYEGVAIEKGGVNFSHIFGDTLPKAASTRHPDLSGYRYQAMGVSVVIHPRNPYAPTTHFNVRFFYAEKPGCDPVWWFGGGFDLTPYYGFTEDCQHWHQTAFEACKSFGETIYPQYKKACDTYFYLPHRQEARGIGGLFFDDLCEGGFTHCFSLAQSIADHFLLAYQPILARRKNHSYTERERAFQQYRRARYVEFNLLYDRGTLFGLQSGGRTESILMSMPPQATWRYKTEVEHDPDEEKLLSFLSPRDWLKRGD